MSTRQRTPQYFPAMKVRGAGRRRKAELQRIVRTFGQIGAAASVATAAFNRFAVTLAAAAEAVHARQAALSADLNIQGSTLWGRTRKRAWRGAT
jgi:hypothetical protein